MDRNGCYKIILNCDIELKGFYEKCGLKYTNIHSYIKLLKVYIINTGDEVECIY